MAANETVLIVDRDSDLVSILSSYLTMSGYRVCFTTRVREALRKLAFQKFSHVFLDPDLAPDNALQILDELSSPNSMNSRTPLILMTFNLEYTLPMPSVKRIQAILAKPFPLGEFAFQLEATLAKQRAG
jgi:DNA-binding NtrC family response regulator